MVIVVAWPSSSASASAGGQSLAVTVVDTFAVAVDVVRHGSREIHGGAPAGLTTVGDAIYSN